jgi:hypothetical protein
MKNLSRCLSAIALFAPALLPAASFEGRVAFKMTSTRGPVQELAYNIKGDKIRLEMPGQNTMGGIIIDTTKRETTIVMDQQKMYMTMPIPDVAAQSAGKKGEDVKLEKTGEKETILGYPAEKYVTTQQDTTTEMWLAEGLGTFMSAPSGNPMGGGRGGNNQAQAWERALAGKELFPLRVVSKDKAGKESFRMEATAVDKKPLADSLFAPPAGYQKFDMGGMMKGMGLPGMGK